jgi:hypothetical protein
MRTFVFIFIIFLSSCWSKYPAERYVISRTYRDLISSFNKGDTLKFNDSKGNICLYLISNIDSSFIDEGKGLIGAKGRKDIVVTCHELTNPRRGYEDYAMIILNRYPDDDSATFDLRLRDFYGLNSKDPIKFNTDTIKANAIVFTNYYSFRPFNSAEQKDSNSVTQIYMTSKQGIVAYRCLNGTWWTFVQ